MKTKTENTKVIFHTNTTIDPISWEMQGISAKTTNDPIGRFGTGLCYAIAVLLRLGHKVSIKTSENLYVFDTEDMTFRDKEFKRVTCNGKAMSFTLEYGKDWECWGAYRELVSNTMDEDGIHFAGEPMEEGTSIIVEGQPILDCLDNHDDYFLGSREPVAKSPRMKVFKGNGIIYLKGVKVGQVENGMYSYEFESIDLTEDRTIKHQFLLEYSVGENITKMNDREFIREFLLSDEGSFESSVSIDYSWTQGFEEVILNLWKTQPTKLSRNWIKVIRNNNPSATWAEVEMTGSQKMDISSAKGFLEKAGYPVTAQIILVNNKDENCIAFQTEGKIYLSQRSFDKGVFFLCEVLFEEQSHVKGHVDLCRNFQTYLIQQVLIQSKNHLKISL